jgi:hypothetical protein
MHTLKNRIREEGTGHVLVTVAVSCVLHCIKNCNIVLYSYHSFVACLRLGD